MTEAEKIDHVTRFIKTNGEVSELNIHAELCRLGLKPSHFEAKSLIKRLDEEGYIFVSGDFISLSSLGRELLDAGGYKDMMASIALLKSDSLERARLLAIEDKIFKRRATLLNVIAIVISIVVAIFK